MIVFVIARSDQRGLARQLRDALVRAGEASGATVEANDLLDSTAMKDGHVRFDLLRRALESWADLHRGAMAQVIAVDTRDERWIADLAFWVRRRSGQRCAAVRAPDTDPAVWAANVAHALRDGAAGVIAPADLPQPRIESDRLVLTPPTVSQARDYYRRIVGTRMFDTLMWDGPGSVDELLDKYLEFEQLNLRGPRGPCVVGIIERETDRQIGAIGSRPHAADPARLEIGYGLEVGVHGRGYGTEAIGAFVQYLFHHRGAERIEAEVFVGNRASRRVLEKNGFRCEVEDSPLRCPKRGERKNEWAFVLTRPMWESLVVF